MFNSDTELLFPMRVTPALRSLRGPRWRELVERVCAQASDSLDRLAFTLLMIRLDGCLTCNADSYRAMRGCTYCATQSVRRFHGSDEELIAQFEKARDEVSRYREQTELRREA